MDGKAVRHQNANRAIAVILQLNLGQGGAAGSEFAVHCQGDTLDRQRVTGSFRAVGGKFLALRLGKVLPAEPDLIWGNIGPKRPTTEHERRRQGSLTRPGHINPPL